MRIRGLGFRIYDAGMRVEGSGFKDYGLGFLV